MENQYQKDMRQVQKNGYSLRYIRNQTPELCLHAVTQNGLALKYVLNQTTELCKKAIEENPEALCYVKNKTRELCILALKMDKNVIADVSPELLSEIVDSFLSQQEN